MDLQVGLKEVLWCFNWYSRTQTSSVHRLTFLPKGVLCLSLPSPVDTLWPAVGNETGFWHWCVCVCVYCFLHLHAVGNCLLTDFTDSTTVTVIYLRALHVDSVLFSLQSLSLFPLMFPFSFYKQKS